MHARYPLFISLLLALSTLFAQGESEMLPPGDPRAEALIARGKQYLTRDAYDLAARSFEEAALRPFHPASTAAIYLSGLAHYRAGRPLQARAWFERLATEYPASRYVREARYHLGVMGLQSGKGKEQAQGAEWLIALLPADTLDELAEDALTQLRRYWFFECSLRDVEDALVQAPPQVRASLLEAICFHHVDRGDADAARQAYANYRQKHPTFTSLYIERLLNRLPPREEETLAAIALVMPLWLSHVPPDSAEALPSRQRSMLAFYEGMQMAMEDYAPLARKQFFLKVIDSGQHNDSLAQRLSELTDLRPDLVIGDIYNAQSALLSQWSERSGTPQIIPLSPSPGLIEGKAYTFLAHPSGQRHGHALAEYAYLVEGMDRVVVWSDGQPGTDLLGDAFSLTFDTLGGTVIRLEIDSAIAADTRDELQTLVRSLKVQGVDGVYLPMLNNEEIAGLILSEIQLQKLEVRVMGSPAWRSQYDQIDRDAKEQYGVIFTTSYMTESIDPAYHQFFQAYLRRYHLPPSQWAVQGYDLGMYTLTLLDGYQPQRDGPLVEYMRRFPAFQGLHQGFEFMGDQMNQQVNIGAFQVKGPLIKLNRRPRLNLEQLATPGQR